MSVKGRHAYRVARDRRSEHSGSGCELSRRKATWEWKHQDCGRLPNAVSEVPEERFCQPGKYIIKEKPSFGYRTVAHLLQFNKNTVQRTFQLMHWQVKKRPARFRPRVQAMPSRAAVPNERCATDRCGFEVVETGGPSLRSQWTVTAESSWVGICAAVVDQRPRSQSGAAPDCSLWNSGTGPEVLLTSFGQSAVFYFSQLWPA
jgi:hypothetical protein